VLALPRKGCVQRHARLRRRQGGHVGSLLIEVLGDVVVADAVVVHGRQRVDALAVGRRRRCIARVLMVCLRITAAGPDAPPTDSLHSSHLSDASSCHAHATMGDMQIDNRLLVGISLCRDQQLHISHLRTSGGQTVINTLMNSL